MNSGSDFHESKMSAYPMLRTLKQNMQERKKRLSESKFDTLFVDGNLGGLARKYSALASRYPSDFQHQRQALAFLSEVTFRCLYLGEISEDIADAFSCHLRLNPCFPEQPEAMEAIWEGDWGLAEQLISHAASDLQRKASEWAATAGPGEPGTSTHLIIVSVPYSGVSAIAPLLSSYLRIFNFKTVNDSTILEEEIHKAEQCGERVFAYFHAAHTETELFFSNPSLAVFFLHRDFRDVLVSSTAGIIAEMFPDREVTAANQTELQISASGFRLDNLDIASVPYWQAMAARSPRFRVITFPELKANVIGMATQMLASINVPIDLRLLENLANRVNFAAVAGRPEGTSSSFIRKGPFVYRNGTSGQWRTSFDRYCADVFAAKYGHLLIASGWETDLSWVSTIAR